MGDDTGDVDEGLPPPPAVIPLPCMKCRRTVWVKRGEKTYVVCDDCETDEAG